MAIFPGSLSVPRSVNMNFGVLLLATLAFGIPVMARNYSLVQTIFVPTYDRGEFVAKYLANNPRKYHFLNPNAVADLRFEIIPDERDPLYRNQWQRTKRWPLFVTTETA